MPTTSAIAAGSPRIISRAFRDDADFWSVRDMLVETYPLMPPDFNWDMRHWDSSRFYNRDAALDPEWQQTMRIWETESGRVVGLAHQDGPGNCFLEVHPVFRPLIEEQMLAWAEENLSTVEDGQRRVDLYVYDYDLMRLQIIRRRGYEKFPESGTVRRLRLQNRSFPEPVMPAGYVMRTTRPGDRGDYQRIADLLNAAFRRTFHNPDEYDTFVTHAPSFRHDLNLVVEAPDGSFAAHVGVNYDPVNRAGIYEPVCTHPDHRRKGLARALMQEGLCRLSALGAAEATVATYDFLDSNHLYETLICGEVYHGDVWRKTCL